MNNVCLGTVDKNTETFLKVRFIDQSDINYQHDALHMYVGNGPPILRNQTALNNLLGEVYSIESNKKIPKNCSLSSLTYPR